MENRCNCKCIVLDDKDGNTMYDKSKSKIVQIVSLSMPLYVIQCNRLKRIFIKHVYGRA